MNPSASPWAAALLGMELGHAPMAAEMQPLEAFARLPHIRNATISPDGRHVAFITSVDDLSVAMTLNRAAPDAPMKPIVASESGKYEVEWCNWANDTRLLCGLTGMTEDRGHIYPYTRLVAINADGSGIKLLIQNSEAGGAQFQDRILDWTRTNPTPCSSSSMTM